MADTLRLGDHCSKIGSGATPRGGKDAYLAEGPFTLIRSQNIHNDRFVHDGLAFISEEQAKQLQNVEVREGDVLLNITGDSVARACQVDRNVLPARVNQHVAIIRPNPNEIDAKYLRYFLVTTEMQGHMLSLAAAGATRNALTKGMIENFRIPAKKINEQIAIAAILGALDDKIDLNRRMNETLEAMARAIYKDWFVDLVPLRAKIEGREPYLDPELWALFPDRLDDEGVPEGWRMGELQEIIELNPREPLMQGVEAPYLDMAALPTKGSTPDSAVPRVFTSGMRFRNGDTLMARITPCLENGKTAFIQSLPDETVGWGSTEFIVLRAKPPAPAALTYLLARDSAFRAHAIQSMTGTSGRQRARTEALASYPVAIPNKEVWIAFAGLIKPMFDRFRANGEESSILAQTRDLLLPRLMSGEIQVGKMKQ